MKLVVAQLWRKRMSRLEIPIPNKAQVVVEQLYKDLERRIEASPSGLCPIDMSKAFLELCHAQTCGKCVPCRVGLRQLKNMKWKSFHTNFGRDEGNRA